MRVLWMFLTLGAVATVPACGTDAVGIEACRDIEFARCEAAPACNADVDVALCKHFYRDQCLHGIENTARTPSETEVKACVAAIKAVGACAKTSPPPDIGTCVGAEQLLVGTPTTLTPCEILIGRTDPPPTNATYGPQTLIACAFVAAPVAVPDAGAPGTGGAAGAATGGGGGTGTTGGTGGGSGGTGGTGGTGGG